jgi:hypothetical protein
VPFLKTSWRQLREAMGEQTMEFRSSGCALAMLAYTLLAGAGIRLIIRIKKRSFGMQAQ